MKRETSPMHTGPGNTSSPHRGEGSSGGFTLIELLIVVAIISVIASLLLTGVNNSIRQAHRAECLNFQRQLMLLRLMEKHHSLEFCGGKTYLGGLPVAASCWQCHAGVP